MQILPANELSEVIKHFLFLNGKKSDGKMLRLFSDGNTGVVFTAYNNLSLDLNKNNLLERLPSSFLYGQISQFRNIHLFNDTPLIVVVFQPTGIKRLLGIPANQLRDSIISIGDIFGKGGLEVEEQLAEQSTIQDKLNLLNTFFINLFFKNNIKKEDLISASINFILKNKGLNTVSQLVKFTGYTERHMERKFMESVGISPRSFASIIKLHCFLQHLKNKNNEVNLTTIAYEAGYVDQSHLIKEFKKHTGMTPSLYVNKVSKLAVNFVAFPATRMNSNT